MCAWKSLVRKHWSCAESLISSSLLLLLPLSLPLSSLLLLLLLCCERTECPLQSNAGIQIYTRLDIHEALVGNVQIFYLPGLSFVCAENPKVNFILDLGVSQSFTITDTEASVDVQHMPLLRHLSHVKLLVWKLSICTIGEDRL